MKPIARVWCTVIAATVAVVVASCAPRAPETGAPRYEASQSTSAHGLSVSVFVSKQKIGIADRLEVLIEARSADGQPVQWPAMLAATERGACFPPNPSDPQVSDWTVVDVRHRLLAPGHESLELVLEPYLDGDKPIPSLLFEVAGKDLRTEPVAVKVIAEHKVDASAAADPLTALASLSPPLAPVEPRRAWFMHPLTWSLSAAALVLLLGGSAAWVTVRSRRRRRPGADQFLDQTLTLGKAAIAQAGAAVAGEVAEKSVGALRLWLAATGRLARGASGEELIAWVRATPAPSAGETARRLAAYEALRFAPGVRAEHADVQAMVEAIWRLTRELRAAAESSPAAAGAASGGRAP